MLSRDTDGTNTMYKAHLPINGSGLISTERKLCKNVQREMALKEEVGRMLKENLTEEDQSRLESLQQELASLDMDHWFLGVGVVRYSIFIP